MVAFFNFKGMAVKSVQFKGIVRNLSPLNNVDGSCEEVINLRLDSGAWRVVGKKRRILKNVDYDQVYVHKYGAFENYIGVKDGRVTWFGSVVDGVVVSKEQEVCRTSGEVVFACMNNILLVNDGTKIAKSVFVEDKYQTYIISLPSLPDLIIDTEDKLETTKGGRADRIKVRGSFIGSGGVSIGDDTDNIYMEALDFKLALWKDEIYRFYPNPSDLEDANATIKGLYNSHVNMNDTHRSGYVFITYCYQLYDGTETKMAALKLVNLGTVYNPAMLYVSRLVAMDASGSDVTADYIGYEISVAPSEVTLHSLKVNFKKLPDYEIYKDIIAKINIYVSQPIDIYDWDNFDISYLACRNKDGKLYNMRMAKNIKNGLTEKRLNSVDVDGLLLYRVEQYDLGKEPKERVVNFKDLTTNPTMPVDASGWLETLGSMYVYNNRLHLFDVKQIFNKDRHILYSDSLHNDLPKIEAKYLVYIKNPNGDAKVLLDGYVYRVSDSVFRYAEFISFADSRAYKIDVHFLDFKYTIFLDNSKTYNFAFNATIDRDIKISGLIKAPVSNENLLLQDENKIIVSEVANPYFFPPEHSYLAPGEVVSMAVANDQISESQVGQYPLYVFTTEGVYALQVGEGKVLYSNIIPISAEVATGGVLQTKYGIVFVTGSGLKLISGRDVVDVSEPICGMLEGNLRESKDFRGITNHELLYDARSILSAVPFEEYVKGAVMGYDLRKDELIVSNAVYGYSYVFGLKSRVWHKITEVFESFNRYVGLMREGDGCSVCDVREEEDCVQVVHLHTRPMCLDSYGFKKMTHVLFRGEFKPNDKRHGVYVFGSNGLDDWRCVADGQFVVDRCHVPLARIFYSFRYFAIVCGGEVRPGHLITHVDFDGEVMFDNRMR